MKKQPTYGIYVTTNFYAGSFNDPGNHWLDINLTQQSNTLINGGINVY